MEKTREVILKCWKGNGMAKIEVVTSKYPFNRRVIIAELHSPITIDDGAGFKIEVHGDGRIKKKIEGFRRMADKDEKEWLITY